MALPSTPPPPSEDIVVVSTGFLPGFQIVRTIGFTYGLIVRSRGLGRNIVAGLRTIGGGEIKEYTQLLEQSRGEALQRLKDHARALGANAVLSVRFDSSEMGETMTEILAYGTAVQAAPDPRPAQPVTLR